MTIRSQAEAEKRRRRKSPGRARVRRPRTGVRTRRPEEQRGESKDLSRGGRRKKRRKEGKITTGGDPTMEARLEEMGMTNEQFWDWKLQLKRRMEKALAKIQGTGTEDMEEIIKDLDETLKKP